MMFRGTVRRIFFVGIGGSGMSGIAEVLCNMGFAVSGSDLKESAVVARLRGLGAEVRIGHAAANIDQVDVVVRSSAVMADNPEILEAHRQKIPVIPRAEMLAELMRMKYGLAIAGTHGKTTTTSMVATCLHHEAGRLRELGGAEATRGASFDPTVVIGGRLDTFGSSARLGQGDYLVAEADESDGSFLLLQPTVAVVTNIDPEHMEHWASFDALVDGFVRFANSVPFFGFAVVCVDHPVVQDALPRLRRRTISYGFAAHAEYRADRVRQAGRTLHFRVWRREEILGELQLAVPGRHNVQNALAAVAVAMEVGIPFEGVRQALHNFGGVDRRFSERHDVGGVLMIDDYGHHPVEIQATLLAAAEAYDGRRIVAVVQPHRPSRVHHLLHEFCRSFNAANLVLVCPIYAAGEAPIPGVDHLGIVNGLREHGHRGAEAVDSLDGAISRLLEVLRPGDVLVTLGAGDVNRILSPLAGRLGDAL